MDDVIANKAATIERSLDRIRMILTSGSDLHENIDVQDIVILNLQRAIQATIDMSTHYVRVHKLGIPQTYGGSFEILRDHKVLDGTLTDNLVNMEGFRNIAVHDYQRLNMDIVRSIITERLGDLEELSSILISKTSR